MNCNVGYKCFLYEASWDGVSGPIDRQFTRSSTLQKIIFWVVFCPVPSVELINAGSSFLIDHVFIDLMPVSRARAAISRHPLKCMPRAVSYAN